MLSSNGVRQSIKMPVDEKSALKGSWELIQNKLDYLWTRWTVEYLPIISRRSKWFKEVAPIEVGALVMIADGKIRNQWIRGRVTRTYPGKDGAVRLADVETPTGVLKRRAVCKLAVLDVCDRQEPAMSNGDIGNGHHGADRRGYGAVEPVFTRHEGEDVATTASIEAPLERIETIHANEWGTVKSNKN